ncbi:S8 family peptidase [Kribbella sp. NPDC056345]|uniref:S8 family peptidase n=1 Tax=Kribbella sp. NPDC056345 TaxID=3345789 RepID=UPI0035E0C056
MVLRSRSWAVVALALVGAGLSGPAEASSGAPAPAVGGARKITLITGDTVTLEAGALGRVSIQPGPGRRGVMFSAHRSKEHLYVVPSDVRTAVDGGRLDRRLFDVAALDDDRTSSSIPLLITARGKRAAVPGATVTRELRSVSGAAIKVDKTAAAGFLSRAAGMDKIWLDGKRKLTLDQSVPQIGAPAAWQAGFTGDGVSVAVLDSGIDTSHPDLATQVAGAKNFTDTPDGDHNGHGTHVASTIAGTGAASSGRYQGVAPKAKLYDGKVCDDNGGCQESAVLAGMEWAATEVKAKIVNLSLGGRDTPEVDPLEEAVNRLSTQTGALFVIAAGNEGPDAHTVASPGSAEAALTVGAVDKQDQLAEFSSRGPSAGAVKPDLTAPGVSIVAAKAKDSIIGEPVGDDYLRLDGTSMATPHVAGSAALLAQQHPDWKATELKGALVGSARPAADQTAFEQGAGRVDVAQGIKQTVIAEPGNLSFGTASWPHDDDTPVTKTVTYRNLGDQPVTLDLAASLNDPTGSPAPAGALVLSASTVTVPARGTAAVQATSNTKHGGPVGAYSGRLTASGGGQHLTSAVGVEKEAEVYNLTIKHLGPGEDPGARVWGLNQDVDRYLPGATATVRLPRGEYLIDSRQQLGDDHYWMVQPSLQLTKDSTVVLDSRTTKTVNLTLPQPEAELIVADVGYVRTASDPARRMAVNGMTFDLARVHVAQVGPAVASMTGHIMSQWGKPAPDGGFRNTPYLYGLVDLTPGVFPTGLDRTVRNTELAVVDHTVNATSDRPVERLLSPGKPDGTGFVIPGVPFDAPVRTRAFLEPGLSWSTSVIDPEQFGVIAGVGSGRKTYRAGASYSERYNAAPFVPLPSLAQRFQGRLRVNIGPTGDADGNRGRSETASATSVLFRDGVKIAETPRFGYVDVSGLPADKASYRFESSHTRPSSASFSTRTDLVWTFRSAGTAEPATLPLLGVRYRPKVNSHNVVQRKPVSVVPLVIDAQPGATVLGVKKLAIQVSGDGGTTWHPASVAATGGGAYQATFATPDGAARISLRSSLIDADGNTIEQTVIDAYPLG